MTSSIKSIKSQKKAQEGEGKKATSTFNPDRELILKSDLENNSYKENKQISSRFSRKSHKKRRKKNL